MTAAISFSLGKKQTPLILRLSKDDTLYSSLRKREVRRDLLLCGHPGLDPGSHLFPFYFPLRKRGIKGDLNKRRTA